MNKQERISADGIATLEAALSGEVLRPGDPGFDEARRVHNGLIDRRPAAIARCQGTADVVDALAFGIAQGLEIAVRGGGDNVAGRAVCEGGLMIDLSPMKGIWVDPARRRARAQAGVCWGEFNRATQLHGLATTGGGVSTTGIAGLTLGGGFGYLMGLHGYTIDNLLSAELVTAAGEVLTASEAENPELFWGLRGGGGNFGIATSFEYALHPVGPMLQGGLAAFDAADTERSLRFLRDLAEDSDDEVTAISSLTHAPDGSGRKLAGMVVAHFGAEAKANALLDRVRAIAPPVVDRLGPVSYCDLNGLLDPSFPKLALNYWKTCFVASLSDEVIEILAQQFARCPSPMGKLIVERPHGAALRQNAEDTAFPIRTPGFNVLVLAQWRDPAETERNIAWARETYRRLEPHAAPAAYSNYMGDDETPGRVAQAYGMNLDRLQALKDRYDPENVFHLNQNIPPAR